ncbi:lipopolysaccharide biosynthesis protein [Anianabacter salinae]|uniref:lipopolysaccharide biosynthesis protein n=1 Tax=Anianabacter salinae TaxID=2851023 RepID=UPI00225E3FAB|nr:oligosaccharide flippase family protein [Anianabacter salinae]MBV0913481.1 oligosaccharide flippase family protein [Anianabacter salinae]
MASRLRSLVLGRNLAGVLIRAVLGSAGVRLLGMAATFLVGVQLARALGPDGFGVYGTVMAIVLLLAVPAQLALPQLLTRELASSGTPAYRARARASLTWFPLVVAVSSLTLTALCLAALALWPWDLSDAIRRTLHWAVWLVPLTAFLNLGVAAIRGFHHVVSAQVYDALLRPALFAALLIVAGVLGATMRPERAIALQALAAIVTLALLIVHAARIAPPDLIASKGKAEPGAWTAAALPMTGTEVLRVLDGQYPILLLGVIASLQEVGQFRVALAAAGFVGLPTTLITLVIMPHVAQFWAAQDKERMAKLAGGAALATFLSVLLMLIALVAVGRPLIGLLFGPDYLAAWPPLVLISTAFLISAAFGAVATILNMSGEERTVTVAYAVSPVVGAGTTLLLYPGLGLSAAGVGLILSELLKGLILVRRAQRALGVDPSILGARHIFGHIAGGKPRKAAGE